MEKHELEMLIKDLKNYKYVLGEMELRVFVKMLKKDGVNFDENPKEVERLYNNEINRLNTDIAKLEADLINLY
ncbi:MULTISPECIES: hypothetical protein [Acinetobacter]|uniref:hypothetical protein n=1 Tax=Acinetobacter TaxID=469 RepID=UPI000CFF5A46|nr:hypothetical protein [Acinetobacter sp. MYb10]QLD61408.1 hypothetical protein CQZ96_009055 [Acinetobacter sp. MYb10]